MVAIWFGMGYYGRSAIGPNKEIEMPAIFKNADDNYFDYPEAKEVKKEGGSYVVYDAYGSVLGSHPVAEIVEFTTAPIPQGPKS
jgi:hypothetical protein